MGSDLGLLRAGRQELVDIGALGGLIVLQRRKDPDRAFAASMEWYRFTRVKRQSPA